MKKIYYFSLFIALSTIFFACKNDVKDTEVKVVQNSQPIVKKEKPTISPEKIKINNSVLLKIMVTPELKTFASSLVTVGLTDKLSKENGPFTILAPSNKAFANLDPEKYKARYNVTNSENLSQIIKTHIVEGNFDSATLVQYINKNGSLKLKTLSGVVLIASMDGNEIVIEDNQGTIAIMGKSDIKGQNGILHIIDTVLNIN